MRQVEYRSTSARQSLSPVIGTSVWERNKRRAFKCPSRSNNNWFCNTLLCSPPFARFLLSGKKSSCTSCRLIFFPSARCLLFALLLSRASFICRNVECWDDNHSINYSCCLPLSFCRSLVVRDEKNRVRNKKRNENQCYARCGVESRRSTGMESAVMNRVRVVSVIEQCFYVDS